MPFLGRSSGAGKSNVLLDAITTSATATYNLTKDSAAYSPTGATSLIVSLNGVTQAPVTGFTVNGSAITFDSALASTDVIDYIVGHDSVVKTLAVSDASITTSKITNDAVTADKLADSINSAIAENSAKVTNAITTHTGDVTGGAALTIANNAVDIAKLNVTDGTAGQFLKTDGNNVLSFGTVAAPVLSYNAWLVKSGTYTALSGDQLIANAPSTAFTINLPASPSEGDTVTFKNTGAALLTVGRNGSNINSAGSDSTMPQGNAAQLVFIDATIGWLVL